MARNEDMLVKDLLLKLNGLDPKLPVVFFAYDDDRQTVFDIAGVAPGDGEIIRREGKPVGVKFGRTATSTPVVLVELTPDP